jgi:hypothetical protein
MRGVVQLDIQMHRPQRLSKDTHASIILPVGRIAQLVRAHGSHP